MLKNKPVDKNRLRPTSPFLRATALYAIARICYRPSVCLSVTRVDQSKTLEVRITQRSPLSSPMTLVSSRLISFRKSKGNIQGSEGAK